MLLTSLWIVDLFIVFATIAIITYKYSTRKYDYFKKRNIKYVKPVPFLGSMASVLTMKITIGEWLRDLYKSIDAPYFGIFVFDEPYLIVKSPKLIKEILVKDFNKFSDRTVLAAKHNEIMSNMLFFQKNPEWRTTRTKISPVFTSGKLKGMFSIINEVGLELSRYIKKNLGVMDSKAIATKYSTDVIAKCAFAINAHSFEKEDTEFRRVGKHLFDFTWRNAFVQTTYLFKQNLANLLHLDFFEKWTTDFLKDIFWDAIRKREQSNVKGSDVISIIVEMRKNRDLCNELSFEGDKVVAQAVQFFAAGFETTSSTLSFALYELCLQPKIQDKLRKEIANSIKSHNGITYEGLRDMKYLEMCIFETLRKYPVLPFLDRRCNEEFNFAGTDLVIEKDMPVYVPLMGLHYDEDFFPEPEKYDPERFADMNSYNLNHLVYLPFGEGPRVCIGERFGMLGVKVGLVNILSKFALEKSAETPVPIKFEPKSFLLQSDVGLPMRFTELQPTSA